MGHCNTIQAQYRDRNVERIQRQLKISECTRCWFLPLSLYFPLLLLCVLHHRWFHCVSWPRLHVVSHFCHFQLHFSVTQVVASPQQTRVSVESLCEVYHRKTVVRCKSDQSCVRKLSRSSNFCWDSKMKYFLYFFFLCSWDQRHRRGAGLDAGKWPDGRFHSECECTYTMKPPDGKCLMVWCQKRLISSSKSAARQCLVTRWFLRGG